MCGNETICSLTDGSRDAFTNHIFIQGNDVYIARQKIAPGKSTYQAKYWKNGSPVILSNGPESAFGSSIAISGTDVFVGGYRDGGSGIAQYWKNGTVVPLTDRSRAALVHKITVVRK